MKNLKKHTHHAIHAAVLFMLPFACIAQTTMSEGYVVDGRGAFVGSATPQQCWRTGEWTPALAKEPCDYVATKLAAAPAPQPASQPAPAPLPVAAAPVAKPVPQKLSFSADALFAFDKAVLNPSGKKMLDEASTQLKQTDTESIHVVGYADRIGSPAYNQRLSKQRADAVRDYLVSTGVPLSRIDSKGMGESNPVTKSGECAGKTSPKVIACLQPDRRVDIELQGVKAAAR